jgi:hypothetical protein
MRNLTAPANVELIGFMTMAFISNLQSSETLPVFQKHGLGSVEPDGWYRATTFMDAMNELAEHENLSSNLIAIGMQVGKTVPVPPDDPNPTLEIMLYGWDEAYSSLHRNHNGNIGSIVAEKVTDKHYKTTHTHLYPDDMSYGIAYAYARRFLPKGASFKVYYEPNVRRLDEGGGKSTIIHINWE